MGEDTRGEWEEGLQEMVLWRFSRHGVSVRVEVLCSPRAQQEPRCLWFGHWPIVATLGVQSNFVFTEF